MKKIAVLIVLVVAVMVTSCNEMIVPSRNLVTESRNASEFTHLSVERGVDVSFTIGSELSVTVTASDNVLRYVEVYNLGKELKVRIANDVWFTGGNSVRVHIVAPDLAKVSLSGGSELDMVSLIERSDFKLDLSGGSEFDGVLKVTSASVSLSGGSTCDLTGSAESLSLDASGGSDFGEEEFVTENTRLSVSGGSTVELTANAKLEGSVGGGSDVEYRGTPAVSVSVSGGSRCRPAN